MRRSELDIIKHSGLFDISYYSAQVKRKFDSIDIAIEDFLETGCRAGFDPSEVFSVSDYLAFNGDVGLAKINPLAHFLLYGLKEGRYRLPTRLKLRSVSDLPAQGGNVHVEPDDDCEVVVLIPVYADRLLTLNCIHSVLRARNETRFSVLVVYDGGPDLDLAEDLIKLAEERRITLIVQERNLGFVESCNRGFAQADGADVIILNADTEVYDHWIDRLRAVAHAGPAIASVTPLSNNATIASYPRFVHDNWQCLEVPDRDIDALCRATACEPIEIPVGIGFCMYMKAEALALVGVFDPVIFGRGYGEEVDWCRRAVEYGFRHMLAPTVFVTHFGGCSFGSQEKRNREIEAGEKLEILHPGYRALIHGFIAADPILPVRRALDLARLLNIFGSGRRKTALICCPRWKGGTERHVGELTALLKSEDYAVLRCLPGRDGDEALVIETDHAVGLPNLEKISMRDGVEALVGILRICNIAFIHVHHVLEFPPEARLYFTKLAEALDVPLYVTVHDYLLVCPRINLMDDSGVYCGEPDIGSCERCVACGTRPRIGRPVVWQWLHESAQFLSAARRVFVPSADTHSRMSRRFPDLSFCLRPHLPPQVSHAKKLTPIGRLQSRLLTSPRANAERRSKILVVGAIGPVKGSELLLRVAQHLSSIQAPVQFVVLGYSDRDNDFRYLDNVTFTGAYHESDLDFLIETASPDMCWFPSLWPETFSYTLGHALAYGATIICFDLGAIPDRTQRERLVAMPADMMMDPKAVANGLLEALGRDLSRRPMREPVEPFHRDVASYYELDTAAQAVP